ncbi:MAG: T9SS type B sorting domain-containing protein [Lutibacter sp.]|nr:T9SS type B sorting domain-containing protein [Lutibacter sp.]
MNFKKHSILFFFLLALFLSNYSWAQNIAPTITATGNQTYCPLTQMKVVTSFDITDPDDTTVIAFYIQISEGYKNGEDKLTLPAGTNPNIASSWSPSEGKLTLKSAGLAEATYIDIVAAVKKVVFESSSPNVSGEKKFSFTIGDANYLPSTGHFYQYIPDLGITWTSAKIAAEARTYYGLKGYLATITSAEEAKLSGEQAAGAGWIGGSDTASEGVWKWVTGPENGTVFWNGLANGSTPNFAFWNSGEPNQAGDEDYAHVTAPSVGKLGSWNDLSNTGSTSGDYQPKGYIVEYGSTPGDPVLNLSASTTISVAAILTTTSATRCGAGTVNLAATATAGATVLWFDAATSTTPINSGPNYAPILSATKTYYVLASVNGCVTGKRTPVVATVYTIPTIISAPNVTVCEGNSGTLNATASSTTPTINWYATPTGGMPVETGSSFTTMPKSTITTYYVDATENGCTSPTRTEVKLEVLGNTVSVTSPITLNDITVVDDSDNNSITINIFPNSSNYEFNLDRFDEFQDGISFEHLEPGIHFLYLRNKTNCGISKLDIAILGFPKFFTPNDDGQNDTWKILGNDTNNIQISAIYIFDRFGKLVADVDLTGDGWDGFYNGERLPATDYWYLVKYTDQYGDYREKRGNLSLIRR